MDKDLPAEVEQCVKEFLKGPIKQKQAKSKILRLLRDPLLWVRVTFLDEEITATYGSETQQSVYDFNPECLRKRHSHCSESLKSGDRVEDLKHVFSDKSLNESILRKAIFPDLPVKVLKEVSESKVAVRRTNEVSDSTEKHKGIVIDLYDFPSESSGWEGYIISTIPKVHKFTSSSCICSFPVCLGSIVEFTLSRDNPAVVAGVTTVQYFPGTLSESYSAEYIYDLCVSKVASSLERVIQLPGPLRAILSEQELFSPYESQLLALLHTISNEDSEYFSRLARRLGIHEPTPCSFLGTLPQKLCIVHNNTQKEGKGRNDDVVHFLGVVSALVRGCPDVAFKMSAMLQGCVNIATHLREEFASHCSVLCKSVLFACSEVRCVSDFTLDVDEESNGSPNLQDPLFWVVHHFGERLARPLRDILPKGLLKENEGDIMKQRNLENYIPSRSAADKKSPRKIFTKIALTQADQSAQLTCLYGGQYIVKRGVVTDLYSTGGFLIHGSDNTGYPGKSLKEFKIDLRSTTICCLGGVPPTLHLGDVVQFSVSTGLPEKVSCVISINIYFSPAMEAAFADSYLKPEHGFVEALVNEAAMKGILNAPEIYNRRELCTRLVGIIEQAMGLSTPIVRKKILQLLKSSSFILDLVKCAPEEVSRSTNIIEGYLKYFPNEVCVLLPTLESLVDFLMKLDRVDEMANFLHFLTTSTCLLPHSVEIAQQPWQCVPTILTEDECKSGAIANSEYLPCVKDRYSSIHEYGRTYFLLLRADCHGQLASYIHHLQCKSLAKMDKEVEIAVYDTIFIGFSNSGSGRKLVCHCRISSQPDSPCNISRDSPLIKPHNLLCLSMGGQFEDDIVWATINRISRYVHERDTQGGVVRECEVCLEFCSESNSLSDEEAMLQLKMSANVVALESPAYFKAYQPVLDGLKLMEIEKVHFLRDFMNPGKETQSNLELINDDTVVTGAACLFRTEGENEQKELTVGLLKEMLCDPDKYKEFFLHKHQRLAVASALSDCLSLIQGPPGTGKSFIGMIILRLFLSMKSGSGEMVLNETPALVIAYKNRALDLFVSMCHEFCPPGDIVRIGHLSEDKKDDLRDTLLKERVMSALGRTLTARYHSTLQNQYHRVREAKTALERVVGLSSLDDYLPYLSPEWFMSLIIDQEMEEYSIDFPGIRDDPERYLNLLQTQQMGRGDRLMGERIRMALEQSWKKWIEEVNNVDQNIPQHTTPLPQYIGTDMGYDPRQEMEYNNIETWNNEIEELSLSYSYINQSESSLPVDVSNVWNLNPAQRLCLIRDSVREQYEAAMENFKQSIRQYNMIRERYEAIYEAKALEILRKAKIVAMTTTGAAIHQRLLSRLKTPLVIIEEAAEILESNILAILSPHVKHMVLIGDQKQLRPNLAWSKLGGEKYRFNRSLFERLIQNKYHRTLLLRQSRMHSSLVPLYGYHYEQHGKNEIKSTEKTDSLEQPACMATNFFWWTYSQKYESKRDNSYFMNEHEVKMVVSLCSWLICNRVPSRNIAILSPYRGQVKEIKLSLENKANAERDMPAMLRDVDVYTVDEYQGHECDVVILSLVRSNSQGKIGFLSTPNRCIVATSRQKCALYIVGNHTFLEKNSPVLWKKFLERVKNVFPDSVDESIPVLVGKNSVTCQTPDELEDMVLDVLKAAANNAEVSEDEQCHTESANTLHTPERGKAKTLSSSPTTSTTLQAGVQESASMRVSRHSVRSQSVDSTPVSVSRLERFQSAPPAQEFSPQTPDSAPAVHTLPEGYLQQHEDDNTFFHQSPSQQSPRLPLAKLHPFLTPPPHARNTRSEWVAVQTSGEVAEVSSTSDSCDIGKCALELKNTKAAGKWKFIGRRLGLDEGNIEIIEKDNAGDLEEQFYQMIMKWKSSKGERATKDALITVLKEEKLNDIAEKLQAEKLERV